MSSSSSVQLKKLQCNEVDDIAGNEVSPTKQEEATAVSNQNSIGDRMEKKPWEKPGQFPSGQMNQ